MMVTNQMASSSSMSPPIAGQKRLVIVGASGMVGSYALRYALDSSAVESVTSIGRKKIGISHPKLKEVVHQNFADCSALTDVLSGQDAAVYCLGAYTGSVSDAELHAVTTDYTIEFARVLHKSSPNAAFSFLSGNGADQTGRSRIAFARYKGEAEKALIATGFPRIFLFRPAYIYPVQPRKEPNFSYRLLRAVYPVFRVLFPNQVIRADDLAWAMVNVVVGPAEKGQQYGIGSFILENRDIRALVESRAVTEGDNK
ncbi:MAG TPA: NAD-dependent epimerase/dehydratase family protein [Terriglobales bacterium]|nr:NAD-dependent epimerase/dehydratase family protein [Terriglobales bacterium]